MSVCPMCGGTDGTGNITFKGKPKEGDVCICLGCAAFLRYKNDMTFEAFSKEQMRRIQADDPMTYAVMTDARNRIMEVHTKP